MDVLLHRNTLNLCSKKCNKQFSIDGYFRSIISRAFRTLDPLSLITAANFDGPILIRISSIFSAIKFPVCELIDKSERRKIYFSRACFVAYPCLVILNGFYSAFWQNI